MQSTISVYLLYLLIACIIWSVGYSTFLYKNRIKQNNLFQKLTELSETRSPTTTLSFYIAPLQRKQPPTHPPRFSANKTIFVSVVSRNDHFLQYFFTNLVQSAKNPQNLTLVVYQENTNSPSFFETDARNVSGIREHVNELIVLDARSVLQKTGINTFQKGEGLARHLTLQLIDERKHTFLLFLESNTTLSKDWDEKLIQSLLGCPRPEFSVITQIPTELNVVKTGLRPFGLEPVTGAILYTSDETRPFLEGNMFQSEGWWPSFSFSTTNMAFDVPLDPLSILDKNALATDMTIRLYTKGWDIFSPGQSLIASTEPSETLAVFDPASLLRMYTRLNLANQVASDLDMRDIEVYRIGTDRSLVEFEFFCAVKIVEQQLFGKSLERVLLFGEDNILRLNGIKY